MNKLKKIFWGLVYAADAYVAICFLDVVFHNLSGGSDAVWNFFNYM